MLRLCHTISNIYTKPHSASTICIIQQVQLLQKRWINKYTGGYISNALDTYEINNHLT